MLMSMLENIGHANSESGIQEINIDLDMSCIKRSPNLFGSLSVTCKVDAVFEVG